MAFLRCAGGLLLCVALLLGQQQSRVHPLSHLHDAAAQDAAHDPTRDHDVGHCARCLADAATASCAPPSTTPSPALAAVWQPAAAVAEAGRTRPTATAHLIRGPPAATMLG